MDKVIAILVLLIITCIFLVFLYMRYKEDYTEEWDPVVSSGYAYNVLTNLKNKENAAKLIADINRRNVALIAHLHRKYGVDKSLRARAGVERLSRRYDPDKIFEIHPHNVYGDTSYVSDKGGRYGMCLRQKKNTSDFVDENTLMFVNLHELAHLCSSSTGHNDEFLYYFCLLLVEAAQIGVYTPIDYTKYPRRFCGIEVTSNPLFIDGKYSPEAVKTLENLW